MCIKIKKISIGLVMAIFFLAACKKTKTNPTETQVEAVLQGNYLVENLNVLGMRLPNTMADIGIDVNNPPVLSLDLLISQFNNMNDNQKLAFVYVINELRKTFVDYTDYMPFEQGAALLYPSFSLEQAYQQVLNSRISPLEKFLEIAEKMQLGAPLRAIATWEYITADQTLYYKEAGVLKVFPPNFFENIYKILVLLMARDKQFLPNENSNLFGLASLVPVFLTLASCERDEQNQITCEYLPDITLESYQDMLGRVNNLLALFPPELLPILLSNFLGIDQELITFLLPYFQSSKQLNPQQEDNIFVLLDTVLNIIHTLEMRFTAQTMSLHAIGGVLLLDPFDITWKNQNYLYARTTLPNSSASLYLEMSKKSQEDRNLVLQLEDVAGGLKLLEYILNILSKPNEGNLAISKSLNHQKLATKLQETLQTKSSFLTPQPGILAVQMFANLKTWNYLLAGLHQNLAVFHLYQLQ